MKAKNGIKRRCDRPARKDSNMGERRGWAGMGRQGQEKGWRSIETKNGGEA